MAQYKILLVDDEVDVRESIARTVDWEACGFSLCGCAAGALEALPASLEEAIARAGGSAFVEKVLSADTARKYLALKQAEQNRWFAARDKEKYQDEAYFGVL